MAVYERGGWYVDSDASCVRPFDQWTPPGDRAGLVVGVEAERWPGHYQPVQVCCLEILSQERQSCVRSGHQRACQQCTARC